MIEIRNILMVYPELFPSFWGMQYYLPLIGRKAFLPPIGLLTIASMCPPKYNFRLVDMNCQSLTDNDIEWADMVLFSAMLPQEVPLFKVAKQCKKAGKLVVFGGPYPTACPEECEPYCDVLVLNEGEVTWPMFLQDLENGSYRKIYTDKAKPDVTKTPCPRFDLINVFDYGMMPIQFSRGCPFQCEFCDIIVMYGRKPRTKTTVQVLKELDVVYETGYRGIIVIVDDNFIANKESVKKLLPSLKVWNEAHGNPFSYVTQASVNLADDPNFINQMSDSKFFWVFIGIETPSIESLNETKKYQNLSGSLEDRIKVIQKEGLFVSGGFIVGFDHDPEDIFEKQIKLINEAAIPDAMISPLVALPGTPLYNRLKKEERLLEGQNNRTFATFSTNIQTKIPYWTLVEGYQKILQSIYDPKAYFQRTLEATCRLPRPKGLRKKLTYFYWTISFYFKLMSCQKSGLKLFQQIWSFIQIFRSFPDEFRCESNKFMLEIIKKRPERLMFVLQEVLMGYHYYRFTYDYVFPEIQKKLNEINDQTLHKAAKLQPKTKRSSP